MLAQVERAVRDKQPVVFLAWDPHPMNMRFDLQCLTGGDEVLDPIMAAPDLYRYPQRLQRGLPKRRQAAR